MSDLSISAILTTHTPNRWPLLERTISSLQPLDIELVGVFESRALADRFECHGRAICAPSIGGLSEARSIGAAAASGTYYAFLDDDVVVTRAWDLAMREVFAGDAIAAGGPALPEWPPGRSRPAYLPRRFDWLVGCGPYLDTVCEVRNTYGCNLAVAADAFEAVGGFDAALGKRGDLRQGEDAALGQRLRERFGEGVTYHPEMVVHHCVFGEQLRVSYLLRRAYWQGRSKARMQIGDAETGFLREALAGLLRQRPVEALASAAFITATGLGYLDGRLRDRA